MGVWGRRVPGRTNRLCKTPEAGVHLVYLRNMEAPLAEA